MPSAGEPSSTDRAAHFRRLMALFESARAVAASERGAWLDAQCAGDGAMRSELARMLASDADGDQRLAPGGGLRALHGSSASGGFVRGLDELGADAAHVPVLRGDYRVLRIVGEGGMGVVYEAEQSFPRRRVALKALHAGRASRRALVRFEQEAHILARLQHGGIAQLYEAGTSNPESGDQAFLAMEFVDGVPLTKFARDRELSLRARVELLAHIADAVQHAHQRRVIHRDLKPANILVAANGSPKILDFGVARLADDDSAHETGVTAAGQLVGTLPYMSPEQVAGDAREVDARTDVYALGVLLYELATGRVPHDARDRSLPQMLVAIRDETPPAPRSIAPAVPRDVEAVCLRALEKDRERRYASAAEFAADLRRWLRGEPVSVRADSSSYIVAKFIQRNRVAAGLAGLAAAALALFAVQSAIAARREAAHAQAMSDALHVANLERGRLLTLTGDIGPAESVLWSEYAAHHDVESRWALWELYAKQPCMRTMSGHADSVLAVACSPDGKRFASVAHDGTIALWDSADGSEHALEPRFATSGSSVIFAGDASVIAFAVDGSLACFDVGSGARRWSRPPDASLRCTAADAAGTRVACAGDGAEVVVLDAEHGAELQRVEAPAGGVRCLEFDPSGARIAIGGAEGVLRVATLAASGDRREVKIDGASAGALAFACGGRALLAGCDDASLRVFDAETCSAIANLPTECGSIQILTVDGRGARALLHGDRGGAGFEFAEPRDARPLQLPAGLTQSMTAIAIGADGRCALAASTGGRMRLWSCDAQPFRRTIDTALGPDSSIALGPASRWFAVATLDGSLDLHRLPDGALERSLAHQDAKFATIAFDERQELLAAGGPFPVIRLWRIPSCELAHTFDLRGRRPISVRLSPNGERVAWAIDGGGVQVASVSSGAIECELGQDLPAVSRIAFSPDGRELAGALLGGKVVVWNLADRSITARIDAGSALSSLRWLGDGGKLALGGYNGQFELWDRETGTVVQHFEGQAQAVDVIASTRDGTLLATGCHDGRVRLWSPRSRAALATLEGGAAPVVNLGFEPSGAGLVGYSVDGSVVRWDLALVEGFAAANAPPGVAYPR